MNMLSIIRSEFTIFSQEIRELNIISHYYSIIDRDTKKYTPPQQFLPCRDVLFNISPLKKSPSEWVPASRHLF